MKRLVILLLFLALATPALCAVPQTMSYQGVLTDGLGNLVPDGTYYFSFNIYLTAVPGPPAIWSECQSLTVTKGGFNAILGSTTPLNLPFDVPYYLGFSVNSVPGVPPCPIATPEVLPRVALAASPYSLSGPNGSGTANFVPVFLGPKTVGNSDIFDIGGKVGIGNFAPTTGLDVAGATRLGTGAPAIKMVKLTGITSAIQGGSVTIATGVAPDKILSVTVLVEYAINSYIEPSYTNNPGYQFNWYTSGGNLTVWNTSANSVSILSKNFKALVTYEE